MSWFKVDDRLPTSRKLMRIPRNKRAAAIGVWTLAGAWSAHDLTDGWIPAYAIEEWGGDETHAQALVDAGMWVPEERDGEEGFAFHKWSEYQPTKADIESKRAKDRERKQQQARDDSGKFAGGTVRGSESTRNPDGIHADSERKVSDSTVPGPARPGPSRPVPSRPGTALKETPLPDDWAPTPEHQAKARELNVDLSREAETFRAHAEANDRRAKRWNAAFTQWLLKARPMPRGATPLPIPGGRQLEEWEIRG